MKVFPLLALLSALLLAGCHPSGGSEESPTAAELPHSARGYELYSWPVSDGFHFALLPATDRLRTPAEVVAPATRLKSTAALRERLEWLPRGEQLFWATRIGSELALPPESVLAEVAQHARRLGLRLRW